MNCFTDIHESFTIVTFDNGKLLTSLKIASVQESNMAASNNNSNNNNNHCDNLTDIKWTFTHNNQ